MRSVDVLIIGAGQAGLGAAYWLGRITGLQIQVIEQNTVGNGWLERWDSLRLFTPRRFSGLPACGSRWVRTSPTSGRSLIT